MKLKLLLAILVISAGCGQAEKANDSEAPVPTVVQPEKAEEKTYSHQPFTREDAESLIGKFYVQLNQDAKYALYKTVVTSSINIDTVYHPDTVKVNFSTKGIKWLDPNKPADTVAFNEDIEFKVYRYKQIWWADKLRNPETVVPIIEQPKK